MSRSKSDQGGREITEHINTEVPTAVHELVSGLFERGEIELPMLPTVANEILELCQSEDVDAAKLSEVLHRDQSLAGHVLRIANSPIYQGTVPIVSLQQAVSRLGLQALSDIAVAVAVQGRLFLLPAARETAAKLWRHALATAYFSKEIARTRRRNVESSFLCGLLHDVGKPVVLSALLDAGETLDMEMTSGIQHAAMDEFHTVIGEALAQQWKMPAAVAESVRYHHDDYDQAPTCAEAAMTTCLADHLAHLTLPSHRREVTEEQIRDLPVLESLNIYPDELEALLARQEEVLKSVEAIG